MEEQKINFETAKLAKEKQFGYDFGGTHYVTGFYSEDGINYKEFEMQQEDASRQDYYLRPTQSALQTWLRDIYKCMVYVMPRFDIENNLIKYSCHIIPLDDSIYDESNEEAPIYNKYETALEYGLLEALKVIK